MSDVGWTLEDLLMAQQPVEMHALLECAGRETSSWGPGRMPPTTNLKIPIIRDGLRGQRAQALADDPPPPTSFQI